MLSYEVEVRAPRAEVWSLLAEPARWHEWAPHVRSPSGLGEPEVQAGRSGTVRLAGAVPVAVTILAVDPGREWSWQVGPMRLDHAVEQVRGATVARIDISAAAPLEAGLRVTYGPVVAGLLRNLARVAQRST